MKDLVIPKRYIERQVLIFVGCFTAALLLNVYAILRFRTEWRELLTTLHITFVIAVGLFVILALLQLFGLWIRRIIKKRPIAN